MGEACCREQLLAVNDHKLQLCCHCSPLRDMPLTAHNSGSVLQQQEAEIHGLVEFHALSFTTPVPAPAN